VGCVLSRGRRAGRHDRRAPVRGVEAAGELDPADTAKIYYWATADRNLRRLEGKVRTIVATGRMAKDNAETAERMAAMRIIKSI
jgi:hypothetical protein